MVSRTIPSWTLFGLIRAFLDVAVAYFLLCGSTLGFFAWKFYHVFGLYYLPCPCTGFFGYQNSNLCWHKLLIEWPARKIYSVQKLALNRFPFNLVWFNDQECNLNAKYIKDRKFGNGVIESDGEACSSSPSGLRLRTMVDKESGYDAKGKKIINQKQKSGIRRCRRAAFGYGKSSPVLLSGNFSSAVAGVSCSSYNGGETRSEISEHLGPVSEIDDSFPDNKNNQTGTDGGDGTWHGFEFSNGEEKVSTSMKKINCNTNGKLGITGDEANRIRMLEQALEEEKAAYAALYLELEKERAAAATAADEAMAMILRLQEDKASIEMEAMQYQRMIEEKFAYDEEEMNILKEILVRREKENHLLEKEVEAYRQMNILEDLQQEHDLSYNLSKGQQTPLVSVGLDEDPLLMMNQMGNSGYTRKKEVGKGSSWPSKNEVPSAGKRSHTVAVNLAGKGKAQVDDAIVCQAIATKAAQNVCSIEKTSLSEEGLESNAELGDQLGSNLHNSTLDMEPDIYDVHVVDDTLDIPREENIKESTLPTFSASDHKNSLCDSGRSSFCAVSNERLEIDAEIECLRGRLQVVQGEKEKLTFSADQRERLDTQLKLIEEMVNQLREFQQLKEPVQQSSVPPLASSSKVSSNRRCCRSASDEMDGSA
ncbi:PREDICTED: uncharacterized protein LOC18612780 [Theobroma cacao]|uniref:Uncharacterized protein LOC18612780 n=1 Tax=Theobroma cacao TaxID=3641 RepID=A0AB32VQU9_THECC|nr:PREDICTED: uncharacterized protein LOC18612780 [Theobroma cacao]